MRPISTSQIVSSIQVFLSPGS